MVKKIFLFIVVIALALAAGCTSNAKPTGMPGSTFNTVAGIPLTHASISWSEEYTLPGYAGVGLIRVVIPEDGKVCYIAYRSGAAMYCFDETTSVKKGGVK